MKRIALCLAGVMLAMLLLPMTAVAESAAAPASSTVIPVEGSPSGIAVAEDGTLWITDIWNKVIWTWDGQALKKICGAETDTDLLGKAIGGYQDGTFAKALFDTPYAIAAYTSGFAVTDTGNDAVRLLRNGTVTTAAIQGLSRPTGLACDGESLYIASSGNNKIYKLDADGKASVYLEAALNEPMGLCWFDDALYIADAGSHRVLCAKDGTVTVVAGRESDGDDERFGGSYRNGSAERAGFSSPQGVLACEDGVFVADAGNGALRLIRDGLVTTVACDSELYPASPRGMALLNGRVYVCDIYARTVFSVSAATQEPEYTDIGSDSPVYQAAAQLGTLFTGYPDRSFRPDVTLTRAQFITMLGKFCAALYPYEIITGYGTFSDVLEDAYYADTVAWGVDSDLIAGTGGGRFSPDKAMTREAVATILCKYAKADGRDVSATGDPVCSEWAKDAMRWALQAKILPVTDGASEPLTRGEAALILRNFLLWM